jgi:hypothetical protein
VARLTGQNADQLLNHTASKSWKNDPAFGGSAFTLYFPGNYLDNHCGAIADDYDASPTASYGLCSPVRFTGEHKDPGGRIETSRISAIDELDVLPRKKETQQCTGCAGRYSDHVPQDQAVPQPG